MAMSRKEAEAKVCGLRAAEAAFATYMLGNEEANPDKAIRFIERRKRLSDQLVTAFCADPNAALLEACRRLYDICYFLTIRQVTDLGDDAVVAAGIYPYCPSKKEAKDTEQIDLSWAKEAIEAAEEG